MKAPETDEGWQVDVRQMDEMRPSFWDALVGYGYWDYTEPEPRSEPERHGCWLLEDDDFSSEHGYVPGVDGRSEFEYGEFERWV